MDTHSDLKLIESFLYHPVKGLEYFSDHMDRLEYSCQILQFQMPIRESIKKQVMIAVSEKNILDLYKVRVLYAQDGQFTVVLIPIQPVVLTYPVAVQLHEAPLFISNNPLIFHKTTAGSIRGVYSTIYEKYHLEKDIFEVIFVNEKGCITEGSRSNVFIKQGVQYLTPSVNCGLLPGIIRKKLLSQFDIRETEITIDQFKQADEILLTNSILGIVKAKLLSRP
jgi:branched-subunit amino acid aminotransferase/4-amino-4-deoxychorismate lyase